MRLFSIALIALAASLRVWVLLGHGTVYQTNRFDHRHMLTASPLVQLNDEPLGELFVDHLVSNFIDEHPQTTVVVSSWDPSALVYVTVGLDMKPGAAAVDDDGNGVVDDRGELGATGTDDQVLTPGDVGYQDAEAGKVMAAVLSRGAMRRVEGDAAIEGPGQVRIDVIDDKNRLVSRIIDLVGS